MFRGSLSADLCVVGGGLAGMCAAIAAARRGVRTVLVQDRPVLGGNASGEIRMHICGSRGLLESGLVEEFKLANLARNPYCNYSIWDSVLYEKARFQPNLTLLLNAGCMDAVVSGAPEARHIASVKVWQLTTYTMYDIEADYFVDASGDCILADPSGAEFRVGHEACAEFNESIAPPEADRKVMGMSTLIQFREYPGSRRFVRPDWANRYPDDDALFRRDHAIAPRQNFWWLEFGGDSEPIENTERVRDELLKAAFGIADHVKNVPGHDSENWDLDWVGFLPGKRESRRYVGDHIVTEHDVRGGGKFPDVIAYGGWPLDDHHPAGFHHPGAPTVFHPAPDIFGIPYRSVYSRNVDNLWMAGRNISVSHVALSSSRVMGTCALLGEAVGCAAAVACEYGLSPREVGRKKLTELQQMLLDNDCYLPGVEREIAALCRRAALRSSGSGDAEILRSGLMREPVWNAPEGGWAEYVLPEASEVAEVRIVFDSDLEGRHARRELNMRPHYPLNHPEAELPATLVRAYRVTAESADGTVQVLAEETANSRRLVKIPVGKALRKIRLEVPERGARVVRFDFR